MCGLSLDMHNTNAQVCRDAGVPLLINDRVDVALAAGADGVHVGQSDLPARVVRKMLGPKGILGVSVKSVEQVCRGCDGAGAEACRGCSAHACLTAESNLSLKVQDAQVTGCIAAYTSACMLFHTAYMASHSSTIAVVCRL